MSQRVMFSLIGLAFVGAIRLFMSLTPFANTRPALPEWLQIFNFGYVLLLSILIGKVGKPSNPVRMAVLTFALLIGGAVAIEVLLRAVGYPRYFVIDL